MRFVHADLIAAGLSPLAPERELMAANRLFLQEIELCIVEAEDFAFETTLACRSANRAGVHPKRTAVAIAPPGLPLWRFLPSAGPPLVRQKLHGCFRQKSTFKILPET